jgi:polysaccharide biosynthesis transport protein
MFHYTPTADSAIELTETSRIPLAEQFHQIDLKKFLIHLRTQKRFILGVTLLFVAAAVLFLLLSTPQYTARTQILIDPSDLHVVERGLTSNSQVSEAIVIQVESQVRVLTSDNVLRRVIAREGLDGDREFGGSQASLSRAIANAIFIRFGMPHLVGRVDPTLAALYELQRRSYAKRAERTYVVDVGVTTEDPIKSTRLTNAIAQAYLDEQTTARSDAARQASETLAARLSELKDRVRQAEQRVEEFKARNNILGASVANSSMSSS